ncbi:MAG: nickel pincer cofactor biosynthesis protein LarC [Pirellulales bacterium]|nr:nickel pincer cofactor biosynthesis protein LarC [Pirellulales bacterium]
MRVAYLDCASGISGDMTLAALIDAGADLAAINAGIASLGLAGCRIVAQEVKRHGFRATHITVEHEPEHKHRHLHHIVDMIDKSQVPAAAQQLAKRIFTRLGEAEAKVHGTTIQKVHFHEVGAVDSIADIVGAAMGWTQLGVDRVECAPVPTGTGFIEIAHGRCSVPAPATAELLQGVPLAPSSVDGELTTPTGAAIVATLAAAFGPLPAMRVEKIGYGAGTKDFAEQANILRLLIGEAAGDAVADPSGTTDQIVVLQTNLDDISGEMIGWCIARLWEAGALDVYTTAIQMKKHRPGTTLTVLCPAAQVEAIEAILFAETGTLGIRRWTASRRKLVRSAHEVETPWGKVAGKLAWIGQQASFSPEFDAAAALAARHSVALRDVYAAAQQAFAAAPPPPRP